MGYDDDEEDSEETSNLALTNHSYPGEPSGMLSDRFLFGLVCFTLTLILCTFIGWQVWGTLSKVIISITDLFIGLFNGIGQAAPLIGLMVGLALAAIPLIGVAWLAGHAYVALKGHSLRNRTFVVNPEVNNYGALYDERQGVFVQPIAGELPQRVPSVPQTYSPHITYKDEGATYADYEDETEQLALPSPKDMQRLTIDELARATVYNSMRVPVGRSLTNSTEPVEIEIDGGHILVIGITQKGKSSWIAGHLDLITRTHDRQHVLLAILDLENKTGKLFENVPHLIKVQARRKTITLHARDVHQVAEFLGLLRNEMDHRYTLSEAQQQCQPFVMIYFEEFLSFRRSNKLSTEKRDTAFSDFSELAKRGLKVRMKLVASAQLNYAAREEDVKEAMGNFDTYISFCVKPDAARAAGMISTELLNENFAAKKKGQFVIESDIVTDLVQSPDFPLQQKLLEYEKAKQPEMSEEGNQPFQLQNQDTEHETDSKSARNGQRNEQEPAQEANLHSKVTQEAHLHSKVIQVMEGSGETMKDCIIRVWKVKPGDSEDYRQARAEYEQVQRIIHSMARRGMNIYQAGEQEV